MTIGELINTTGKQHSPYMGTLVNHLPMGQMALYRLTGNTEKSIEYTRYFTQRFRINPVKTGAAPIGSLEECLGNRGDYESCLMVAEEQAKKQGIESLISEILNIYPFGMSSGLFHVLIRLAYAVEGLRLEPVLEAEVLRALAYYVTAYREAGLLERRISTTDIFTEMDALANHSKIRKLLDEKSSMGQQLKALYGDDTYLHMGFLLSGSEAEKIQSLLSLLLPAFDQTVSIVVLHCITGLHALLILRPYFRDFEEAFDIYTTCCLTHLLTVEKLDYRKQETASESPDWDEIIRRGTASRDVHTIKFTYTCHELYLRTGMEGLKQSVMHQINKN